MGSRSPRSRDVREHAKQGAGGDPAPDRSLVFVSYSHADLRWLERLRVHLKPLERHGTITLWDDTRIKPGTPWRQEIRKALQQARVAVLLVTADFLASDFIATNELPPLLKAAEKRGALILPLIVKHSRFEQTEGLARFQAVNSPSRPLSTLRPARRDELFVQLSGTIEEALRTSAAASKRRLPLSPRSRRLSPRNEDTPTGIREVQFGGYTVRARESGTIEVERDGQQVAPAKPALRKLAAKLNLGLQNRNGNPMNTRQLGSLIIRTVEHLESDPTR
jgi:hypothetical protein